MIGLSSLISDIAKIGIVSGIAIYLIWWTTCNISEEINNLTETINQLQNKINELTLIIETLKEVIRKNNK